MTVLGGGAGIVGAICGTFSGAWARQSMAIMFAADRPAAFIEDGVAVVCAALVICAT